MSYVAFLPCRIKFDRNSTSESAAAFLPHVRLVLLYYPTEMRHRFQTSNFCRIESNAYIHTCMHPYKGPVNDLEFGGLNVTDIETLLKAPRQAWIGKLFSNGPLPWKA